MKPLFLLCLGLALLVAGCTSQLQPLVVVADTYIAAVEASYSRELSFIEELPPGPYARARAAIVKKYDPLFSAHDAFIASWELAEQASAIGSPNSTVLIARALDAYRAFVGLAKVVSP